MHTLQAFIDSIDARSYTHSHSLYSPGPLLFLSLIEGLRGPFPTSDCLLQLSLHSEWSHKSSSVHSGWTRTPQVGVGWGEWGYGGGFIFLSLCSFPLTSLHVFSHHFFSPSSFSSFMCLFSVLHFCLCLPFWLAPFLKKAPLADGELATRATSLDESTAGQEKWGVRYRMTLLCWMMFRDCLQVTQTYGVKIKKYVIYKFSQSGQDFYLADWQEEPGLSLKHVYIKDGPLLWLDCASQLFADALIPPGRSLLPNMCRCFAPLLATSYPTKSGSEVEGHACLMLLTVFISSLVFCASTVVEKAS